jgi:hypothetical protein
LKKTREAGHCCMCREDEKKKRKEKTAERYTAGQQGERTAMKMKGVDNPILVL